MCGCASIEGYREIRIAKRNSREVGEVSSLTNEFVKGHVVHNLSYMHIPAESTVRIVDSILVFADAEETGVSDAVDHCKEGRENAGRELVDVR